MSTPAQQETQEQPVKNWSLLAKEAFGNDFHGEVQESAPIEEMPIEEPVETQEEQPQESVETEEATQESEETPISSIEDLIAHYEFDPEWVETLEIPVKINGEDGRAKLADLKASFQMKEAAEERLQEAKEKSRALMAEVTQKREALNSEYATAAALIGKLEQNLTSDEAKIDWQSLREQDPAEWSAKKEEFKQRKDELQTLKQEAVTAYQRQASQQAEEMKEQQQQYLQEQAQMLVEKLPEWKNPETARAEKTAVAEYLINQGFTPEDIAAASDHRMVIMARKAMLYDKGSDKAEIVKKKVTKIPKVVKPGTPKSNDQISREQQEQVRNRLRSGGSLEDAVALMRMKRKG